jgi:hydroxypyruvate reductase
MAAAVRALVGARLTGGVVVTKYGHVDPRLDLGPVQVFEAGHPIPDEAGLLGTRRMVELVANATERDLVLVLLSGGASALLTLPAEGLTLADLRSLTDLLLRSGAAITELNTMRKHLSRVKGGDLARLASPARVIGLVLSDVVGDPLDVIASGPTAPDPSTFSDAWAVLERHNLVECVPRAVVERLKAGMAGCVPETPKPDDPLFQSTILPTIQNVVVGSNRQAAEAAVATARGLGWNCLLLSTYVEGEAREVGRLAAALAREMALHDCPVPRPACLVWGGETTVTVRGQGRGGRNQELALAAAMAMEGLSSVLLVALGTDGTDGPTDAAGAIATGATAARARALGLDPFRSLADNDSYPFFQALDDLIRTGPTGTNVNDLLMLYAW